VSADAMRQLLHMHHNNKDSDDDDSKEGLPQVGVLTVHQAPPSQSQGHPCAPRSQARCYSSPRKPFPTPGWVLPARWATEPPYLCPLVLSTHFEPLDFMSLRPEPVSHSVFQGSMCWINRIRPQENDLIPLLHFQKWG
jgi:hypothetical protein